MRGHLNCLSAGADERGNGQNAKPLSVQNLKMLEVVFVDDCIFLVKK